MTEVALSVQFQKLDKFGFAEIGGLWQKFRDAFPGIEYHPVLPAAFETFGLPNSAGQELRFQFGGLVPPVPRCWFLSASGTQILQFQPDRLVHNWRKVAVENAYPRYEDIRASFGAELQQLADFVTEAGIGPMVPNQCEVTYVNLITASDGKHANVLRLLDSGQGATPVIGALEDVAITARYVIAGPDREPVGRLLVQSTPVVNPEGQLATSLQLTGRGAPAFPTIESALDFLDLARDRIVCGFAEVTTAEMHARWQRSK